MAIQSVILEDTTDFFSELKNSKFLVINISPVKINITIIRLFYMTAAELVAFLAAKGKFIAVEDGFSTHESKICRH
ncbi:DUF2492 family protein [Salmonella enterica subsp. enterica serovar Kentucky]|nr:DUF2492 family protein [Salmonella enterica subsp. enterica serovar Kentucky]